MKSFTNIQKLEMVELLVGFKGINLGILNRSKNMCFEQYMDQFGLDEASNRVEKEYMRLTKGKLF